MSVAAPRSGHGPLGLPLVISTGAGLVVSAYLAAARVAGEAPACGPVKGCETVTTSEYSTVLGIPVAFLGLALSIVLLASGLVWWRRADRRALLLAYGLLLPATLAVAYLTYLELFVIHAVCAWCATYAVATVVSLGLSGMALRRR